MESMVSDLFGWDLVQHLFQKIEKYEKALSYYANEQNWEGHSIESCVFDGGVLARKVLEEARESERNI